MSNAGTAPLSYTVTGAGSGALLPGLRFSVHVGGAASNTGSAAQGTRAGSCGGTAVASRVTLTTTSAPVLTGRRTLAPAGAEVVCLLVELDASAGNELQGAAGAATLVFDARQVLG